MSVLLRDDGRVNKQRLRPAAASNYGMPIMRILLSWAFEPAKLLIGMNPRNIRCTASAPGSSLGEPVRGRADEWDGGAADHFFHRHELSLSRLPMHSTQTPSPALNEPSLETIKMP